LLNAYVAIVLDNRAGLLAAFAGLDIQPEVVVGWDKELPVVVGQDSLPLAAVDLDMAWLVAVGQDNQSRVVADRDS
jgi:hypothetical protein